MVGGIFRSVLESAEKGLELMLQPAPRAEFRVPSSEKKIYIAKQANFEGPAGPRTEFRPALGPSSD